MLYAISPTLIFLNYHSYSGRNGSMLNRKALRVNCCEVWKAWTRSKIATNMKQNWTIFLSKCLIGNMLISIYKNYKIKEWFVTRYRGTCTLLTRKINVPHDIISNCVLSFVNFFKKMFCLILFTPTTQRQEALHFMRFLSSIFHMPSTILFKSHKDFENLIF